MLALSDILTMWKELLQRLTQDSQYQTAVQDSRDMIRTDRRMLGQAIASLRGGEMPADALNIAAADKQVNQAEREIRKRLLLHLSVTGTANLAEGLVLATVVGDLEELGDYAKRISELAEIHGTLSDLGDLEAGVKALETSIDQLAHRTCEVYCQSDVVGARQIMLTYKEELSKKADELLSGLLSNQKSDLGVASASATALYLHYLKRVGALCRQIASSIVNPYHRIGYKEKPEESKAP